MNGTIGKMPAFRTSTDTVPTSRSTRVKVASTAPSSLTSHAIRTSPVFRGKFVLSTFLNTPPPPPLPNVPTLEESNKGASSAPNLQLPRGPAPSWRPTPSERPPPGATIQQWLETLNVLVSLLENSRPDLRGHSSHVARLSRKFCERLGLAERDADEIVAALHRQGR